jgi:hypothetical protein
MGMRPKAFGILLVILVPVLLSGCFGSTPESKKPKNVAPTADFWVEGNLIVNQPVLFDAGHSLDDKGIMSFKWVFDDTFSGDGEKVTHTYSAIGDYHVILTVKDQEGCEGASSKLVHISAEVSFTKTTAKYVETGYIIKTRYAEVNITIINNGGQQLSGAVRALVEMVDTTGAIISSGEQSNNDTVEAGANVLFQYRLDCGSDWTSMSFRASLFHNNTQVEVSKFGWNG